jgi:BCD family chlorophyll transporter-like MFS transporter
LFTVFVFVSMLAYGAQDLVLEPFAGVVFGMTPGESTLLSSTQNKGVLLGMLLIGAHLQRPRGRPFRLGAQLDHRRLPGLGPGARRCSRTPAVVGAGWPLEQTVFALGLANGVYAVGAITSMMQLASNGRSRREGVRMGLWGAAQAIAMGLGMFLGTVAVDAVRAVLGSPVTAFSSVFALQAASASSQPRCWPARIAEHRVVSRIDRKASRDPRIAPANRMTRRERAGSPSTSQRTGRVQ